MGSDPVEFERLTAPLRAELLAHCYRMLGSVHEAEDQVQETYLRAWRSFHSYEGRASVRTWMYRIATNTCLTALKGAGRRPLPTGLGAPAEAPGAPLEEDREIPWLEPLPDPADASVAREGVHLAAVAALQELAPNQRAVLVLRDVLAFSAAETASMMGTSVAACNSALQRARAAVGDGFAREARDPADLDARDRRVWEEFCRAFEAYDIDAVVGLFASDATWQMPPFTGWWRGAAAIGELFTRACPASGPLDLRMVATTCNGMPAAGMYLREDLAHAMGHAATPGEPAAYVPFQLDVLDIEDGRIVGATAFFDTSLFALAGLPARLAA